MIRALRKRCTEKGFDLCDPIHTQWYNNLIEKEGHVTKGTLQKISTPPTISEKSDANDATLKYNAVLIGNSKSIWPKFIDWLSLQYGMKLEHSKEQSEQSKQDILNQVLNDNPFDTFVTSTLSNVFQSCFAEQILNGNEVVSQLSSYEFYWSNGVHYNVALNDRATDNDESNRHTTGDYHCFANDEPSSFLLCMQRAAKVTGQYWHDEEGTKLCVHPKFGTWKAFRAVVVFHTKNKANDTNDSIIPEAPPLCPCPLSEEEIQKARESMEYALKVSGYSNGYAASRGSSGTDDLCQYLHNSVSSGSDWSKVSPSMRPWIQLRDCISVGREEYKYCDNQILYHYTKDVDILKRELNLDR